MNGLLLINKPKGITSFDVIRQLRRTTGVKKIGHAGTLDPLATGLMLMLFGTACRKAQQFSKLDKTYVAELTLGFNSSTGDAEGELIAISDRIPTQSELETVLNKFIGEIEQTPSVYSAIKIDGKEAYKYARAGQAVEVPSRKVTINSIELLSYSYPLVKIEADVSSGTYIRSLAEDIGKELGTGAYLSGLERTRVGDFEASEAVDLDQQPDLYIDRLIQI
ncbi:MAG TPA: tRNA pseudouridine(55) synthase TruB [Candidatus Nanoarchaeia archaeon]|nr:tRNA pseudouridine(55) synthase TruB [Candidatus Nanoarchaeia archaeon]